MASADASTSSSSFSSRLSALASSAHARLVAHPPLTLALAATLALAHALRLGLGIGVLAWCLDVRLVVKKLQLWRLLTGPIAHVGLVHLLFNAWAIVPAASDRELEAGAGVLLLELVFLILASGAAFVVGGEFAHDLSEDVGFLKKIIGEIPRPACAAGASGVALGLLSAAAGSPGAPARFDVGGFLLPGRLRPWLLALAIQLLVPEVSLAGHLSGLACGEVVGAARRSAQVREAVARAGARVEGALRAPLGLLRRGSAWTAAASGGGGGGGGGGGVGASLLLPVSSENSTTGNNGGLGARFAALFKGRRRGGGWQALPGDEAPRGRTTGTTTAAATTMTAAEAARAAAEARAAAAAAAAPTR